MKPKIDKTKFDLITVEGEKYENDVLIRLNGTFVPIPSGHLPIDFRPKIIYNCSKNNNKTPLHRRRVGLFYPKTERVGALSAERKVL
jgi:hypothetical protein